MGYSVLLISVRSIPARRLGPAKQLVFLYRVNLGTYEQTLYNAVHNVTGIIL
jgi:hypothetical protein